MRGMFLYPKISLAVSSVLLKGETRTTLTLSKVGSFLMCWHCSMPAGER